MALSKPFRYLRECLKLIRTKWKEVHDWLPILKWYLKIIESGWRWCTLHRIVLTELRFGLVRSLWSYLVSLNSVRFITFCSDFVWADSFDLHVVYPQPPCYRRFFQARSSDGSSPIAIKRLENSLKVASLSFDSPAGAFYKHLKLNLWPNQHINWWCSTSFNFRSVIRKDCLS